MQMVDNYRYIFFIIATQPASNPQVHLNFLTNDTCRVKFNWYVSVIKFAGSVVWPIKAAIDAEGVFKFQIYKVITGNWSIPVQPLIGSEYSTRIPSTWNTSVVSNVKLNYNTKLLTLRYKKPVFNYIKICHYIVIHQEIEGKLLSNPYAPVPLLPIKSLDNPNRVPGNWFYINQDIHLIVKSKQNDTLSTWLHDRKNGDNVVIGNPMGTFNQLILKNASEFFFFAGGTGITPLLSLSLWILQTKSDASIKLLFYNREERDIFWKHELDDMSRIVERFSVEYILSQPKSDKWSGRKGRVSSAMLRDMIGPHKGQNVKKQFFAACGRKNFSNTIIKSLTEDLGYPIDCVFNFT